MLKQLSFERRKQVLTTYSFLLILAGCYPPTVLLAVSLSPSFLLQPPGREKVYFRKKGKVKLKEGEGALLRSYPTFESILEKDRRHARNVDGRVWPDYRFDRLLWSNCRFRLRH